MRQLQKRGQFLKCIGDAGAMPGQQSTVHEVNPAVVRGGDVQLRELFRVRFGELVRLTGKQNDVRLRGFDLFEGDAWIALGLVGDG